MKFDIVTIFPRMFDQPLAEGVVARGMDAGDIDVKVHDLRAFTTDRHRVVDDVPYGGGPGMVMKPEPFFRAAEHIRATRGEVKIDLLLTDLVMSHMGGAELAERIRDLRPGIPVVFMTGYIGSVRMKYGETVLRKPFSPQELSRTIADVLRAHAKAA